MTKKGIQILSVSAFLQITGSIFITLGVMKQFGIPVFDILFSFGLNEMQAGGIIAIGTPLIIASFWITFLSPKIRKLF